MREVVAKCSSAATIREKNVEIKNAKRVLFDKLATVQASAIEEEMAVKSFCGAMRRRDFTVVIEAEGGEKGGDGGFIEVSGHMLTFQGGVFTLAGNGKAGTLLLDPYNIAIQGAGDVDIFDTGCVGGVETFSTNADAGALLSTVTLVNALTSCGEVIVTTAGIGTLNAGNITVNSNFFPGAVETVSR